MNHKITRIVSTLFFIALLITTPRAQQLATSTQQLPEDRVALYQALLDLTNPWTVMCVAAHPDDEDGTSLIVMRRKYGAHTVSLFSTFGEGGQNAIGPELYEELGAIRARETMAAAEIQGSEPHFLGLKDFGYSKSADETFQKWGHEEALRRMVLQIRKLRPDVIITNHSVTNNDHGHHQATARLELEAFDAAADPKRFPEQLKDGVTTWQVQRLFVRARGNAGQNPARQEGGEQIVTIDPNERDPIRNTIFAEEALRALQKHATQGPWPKTFAEFAARFRAFSGQNAAPGQLPMIRYVLVREAKGTDALTKDSHNFLDGLRLPPEVAKQLTPPTIDGKPLTEFVDHREQVLEALLAANRNLPRGEISWSPAVRPADLRKTAMLGRFNEAEAIAAGVSARAILPTNLLIPGQSGSFEIAITNSGRNPVRVDGIASGIGGQEDYVDLSTEKRVDSVLPAGETIKVSTAYNLPANAPVNVPHSEHLYDTTFAGIPVIAAVFVELRGTKAMIARVRYFDVAPPVEITSALPSTAVITPQTQNVSETLTLQVFNHGTARVHTSIEASIEGIAAVDRPERKRTKLNETPLTIGPGEKRELRITLPFQSKIEERIVRRFVLAPTPASIHKPVPLKLDPKLLFRTADKSSNEVSVPLVYANAHVAPNLHVGYIRGFDFSLPQALNALGVESKELSVDEVKSADLSKFTSIIVDNRVYESQPELIAANQKLLDYANAGGTLIVFYHKSDEWNPDARRNRPQLAPYKLILGNERITDENAPITFLEPDHPLLNVPNKLNQDDFKDWIQERGLYYPKDWDPQFHALLQSNDPGEQPLRGGLLAAEYGRGHYIYSSMVWYRQLRAGVPGAYRMLANMISYGPAAK